MMLAKSSRLRMSFVFKCDGALFQQAWDLWALAVCTRQTLEGFCFPLPHGQSLCSRRGGELPAHISASRLPHFTAELAEETISRRPDESVWGAVSCGFGGVRKQPSIVLPLQRSGGGRKKRRGQNFGAACALYLLLVKVSCQDGFSLYFVSVKEFG